MHSSAAAALCGVCSRQFARYRCPRCFASFCGVGCYRSHNSSGCAEAFYRECTVAHLREQGGGKSNDGSAAEESKRAAAEMTEILRRVQMQDAEESAVGDGGGQLGVSEDNEDGDDDAQGLARLMRSLDEGGDIALEDLPQDIRESFFANIESGAVSKLVSRWTPWWDADGIAQLRARADGTSLIVGGGGIGDEDDGAAEESSLPPLPRQALPPLSRLVADSAALSASLKYHLVSVVYSYCFTKYVYNGDWSSDALDVALCTVEVSGVLEFAGYGANSDRSQGTHAPSSTRQAIMDCMSLAAAHPALSTTAPKPRQEFLFQLVRDSSRICSGRRGAILRALEDLRGLYLSAIREASAPGEGRGQERERHRRLQKCLKKLERKAYFMLVWTNDGSNEESLHVLSRDLEQLAQEEIETALGGGGEVVIP